MRRAFAALLLAGILGFAARAGEVKDTDELVRRSKVTIHKAIDEALKAAPGTVVGAKLFKNVEDGAPTWRVLVHKGETMVEVHVDAASGKTSVRSTWKDETEAEKSRSPRPGDGD